VRHVRAPHVLAKLGLGVKNRSLAAELMIVIDDYSSALYCSCRVLPLGPDYISIS
jgi:hypothetical protein